MVNRKLGRFYTHLAFSEWDGFEIGGAGQSFLIKVTDRDTPCEVYVFEPSLPGEAWNILVLKYGEYESPSPALKAQANLLATRLGADIKEAFGD